MRGAKPVYRPTEASESRERTTGRAGGSKGGSGGKSGGKTGGGSARGAVSRQSVRLWHSPLRVRTLPVVAVTAALQEFKSAARMAKRMQRQNAAYGFATRSDPPKAAERLRLVPHRPGRSDGEEIHDQAGRLIGHWRYLSGEFRPVWLPS